MQGGGERAEDHLLLLGRPHAEVRTFAVGCVGTAALKGVEARTGVLRNIGGVAQNAITTSAARASTVLFA